MRAIDCLVGALAVAARGGGGWWLWYGHLGHSLAKFGLFWACKMGIGLSILSLNFFWI